MPEEIRFQRWGYSQGGTYLKEASISQRRKYPGESSDDDNVNRRSYRDQRPCERGRYPSQSGRPPDQRGYLNRRSPRRGFPNRDGRPPGRGEYPGGGPPDGGVPHNGDGGSLDPLVEEDHQALKDPLGQ